MTNKVDGDDLLFIRTNKSLSKNNNCQVNKEIELEITDISCEDGYTVHRVSYNTIKQNEFFVRILNETKPIDLDTAMNLKEIFVGSPIAPIGPEWIHQYFDFEMKNPQLWYGLIQHKGGPCGVLASVQAYLCAEFFHNDQVDKSLKEIDMNKYRQKCLSKAIGNILWQIGANDQHVVIAIESPQRIIDETKEFRFDTITEYLRICQFHSKSEMNEFLFKMFQDSTHRMGCVSFVYSCILTRGFEQIKQDYDNGSICSLLTTETSLCSQEIVNLCLIGRAVSNVFDKNFNCNDLILQGITKQSTIGFLTFHEYNGRAKVGSCYKSPKLQIYVVLSENHFTVLFSKDKIIGDRFRLYYYDGLMGQDKEICLTIDKKTINDGSDLNNHVHFPNIIPLECIIKTKWPDCRIDWNDSSCLF